MPDDEPGEQLGRGDLRLALCGDGAGTRARRQRRGGAWRRRGCGNRGRDKRHEPGPTVYAIDRGAGGGLIVPTPRLEYRFAISL
jgi:hypothetical protein